jgi:hypothetical protein
MDSFFYYCTIELCTVGTFHLSKYSKQRLTNGYFRSMCPIKAKNAKNVPQVTF